MKPLECYMLHQGLDFTVAFSRCYLAVCGDLQVMHGLVCLPNLEHVARKVAEGRAERGFGGFTGMEKLP